MAIKITLDSFLAVIKRSGLLVEEQLNDALEKFRAANGSTIDGKPFAEYLVRNKQLTVWQAEKVLQGKHKGFFEGLARQTCERRQLSRAISSRGSSGRSPRSSEYRTGL